VIDNLVPPKQAAVFPGRSISDNILLAHEIAHSLETISRSEGFSMVRLHME